MKRFFASVITIILAGLFANSAQCADTCTFTQKNSIEVGGSFSLKSSAYFEKDILPSNGQTQTYTPPPEYDLSFSPYIGWFPADNLELDFGLIFTTQSVTTGEVRYSDFQSSLLGGIAYNFNINSSFFPFIELLGARNLSGGSELGINNPIEDHQYGGRAGCKIAITNNVLINANAQLLHSAANIFTVNVGFSYIP